MPKRPAREEPTVMSELLDAALRMMASAGDGALPGLPALVPYEDYVRRFEAAPAPVRPVPRPSAVAPLLRISRALETLNGFALAHRAGAGGHDSDHLYRAHGDPRD